MKPLVIGICFFPVIPVSAATTNLGSLGNTQLQQDTGDAVQLTCAGFVAAGTAPGTVPLFDTCRAMVHTANEILGTGSVTDTLGLTQEELAAALQQIATEEFAATQSMASEISNNQINTSLTRLAQLRGGGSGFSVSGLFPGSTPVFASNTALKFANPEKGGSAGDDWSKLSGFLSAYYGDGDRDSTDRTDAFDYSSYSITGGVDYRYNPNLILGVALSYHNIDSDFDNTSTVSGGSVDSDGWGGFVYGTYYTEQAYIDGMIGFSVSDYDTRRKISIPSVTAIPAISQTARGSTDSNDFTISIGAGYDFVKDALTYGPYARLSYISVDVDGYSEKGAELTGLNLDVDDQKWKSLTSVIGAQFSYNISKDFGVLIPQANVGWIHEFENDSEEFTATYIADPRKNILRASTDSPDRNYYELGIGVTAVLKNGVQLYASYDTILSFDDLSQNLFSVGGRWEF